MVALFFVIASLLVSTLLHRWLRRPSVKHVKGPPSASFWLGHERVLRDQDNAGDLETKWRREYGTLYRVGGCFGQDVLVVCDPKAFEHIFHQSRPYPKSKDIVFIEDLLLGQGLVTVGNPESGILSYALRKYEVIFQQCSDKLVNEIGRTVTGTDKTVNVLDWTSKATLDIIGLASFRYDFGSLDGQTTELGRAMKHLFTASQSNTTALEHFLIALIRMLPDSVLGFLQLISTREIRLIASVGNAAKKTAREVMDSPDNKAQTPGDDKDVVNLLARARSAGKMQDDEIEAQLMTFVIAGHETSSTSLSWLLYELTVHPEHQSIIRAELKQSNDYDSMPFLNAAIKEALRLHPIGHSLIRTAPHDDVLPLSEGRTLAIPKGQTLVCSAYLYNRLPSLWGDDAEDWNPGRFLDKTLPVSLGVYANLMTFSAGSRSCIGWRFAVVEMQTILANLIQHFEFSLPEGGVEILHFPGSPAVVPITSHSAEPPTAWIAGENGQGYAKRETYSPAEREIWTEYVEEFSSPLQHINYKEWLRTMRSIIVEMGSLQQADARRHIGDVCWEAMVLLDIPRRYRYHENLSDIKNLNWDLEPVKVSSPCNVCRMSKYPCHYTSRDAASECRECYFQGQTCSLGNSQRAGKKRMRADSVEEYEESKPAESKGKEKEHKRKKRKTEPEEDKWDSNLIKRLELQLEAKERQVASLSDERNRLQQCYDVSTNRIAQLQEEVSRQNIRIQELEGRYAQGTDRKWWEKATGR
ncbi:cytochrome P450 [Desarmillaria tabescens]|uniref:Cytochrome P450 n=1 Tax=Armillaria tabescens TaxID=1929756 RepID=A0AA39MQG2_ARMTA|nr:cytochrome P450 [Desarmillaria tabescens]KAK0442279.1 cytochrome P450 [Desarmillaria tabescens]